MKMKETGTKSSGHLFYVKNTNPSRRSIAYAGCLFFGIINSFLYGLPPPLPPLAPV